MPINSQRWFQRKEDYEPRQANADSPFRRFDVKCLKCSSYKLTLTAHLDEQSGETILVLFCSRCREREKVNVKI
jgi:hypothetical protein